MALQPGAPRNAWINARAAPEIADRAAEEIAGYDNRLASIHADASLLKWMAGFNIALTIGVSARLVSH